MKYYLYILKTVFNTLYCGITPNLKKRYEAHCKGKGAKYTKSHKPISIEYIDILDNKSQALKEEYKIKKTLTRCQKLELINANKEKTQTILKNLN